MVLTTTTGAVVVVCSPLAGVVDEETIGLLVTISVVVTSTVVIGSSPGKSVSNLLIVERL